MYAEHCAKRRVICMYLLLGNSVEYGNDSFAFAK